MLGEPPEPPVEAVPSYLTRKLLPLFSLFHTTSCHELSEAQRCTPGIFGFEALNEE